MSIPQMTPDEIYHTFISRISKTNLLYDTLTEDSSIEMSNTIYFKYYFDISTAIEATLRGITYLVCKNNKYLKFLSQPDSDSKAFFLRYDEMKALIELDNAFIHISKEEFINRYSIKISPLKSYTIKSTFKNDGTFMDNYNRARTTRNTLAHGLKAHMAVGFDNETIENFIYVLYILLSYYKNSYAIT